MGDRTGIEWSDATWNPITGCDAVGPGCDNCYAESIAERVRGTHAFPNGFDLTWRPKALDQPLRWKRPRKIFVNSMSDLFHKAVVNSTGNHSIPTCALEYIFNRIEEADWHTYQILTKRSSLMRDWINNRYPHTDSRCVVEPLPHVWLGVSVEDRAHIGRIEHLRATNAAVRFISFEPLLAPIGPVDLSGIHWVIAGGESGRSARPIQSDWVREIRDHCAAQGVAFFFKQWGSCRPLDVINDPANSKTITKGGPKGGCILDGRKHLEFPIIARWNLANTAQEQAT